MKAITRILFILAIMPSLAVLMQLDLIYRPARLIASMHKQTEAKVMSIAKAGVK